MATLVLTDASVTVNSVNLSEWIMQTTVNMGVSDEDFTTMGAEGMARKAGLRDDSFEFEVTQDFAAAAIDATVFPLLGAAPFEVTVRATSAAVSATNPSYEGDCILTSYNPIDGSVGSPLTATLSLPVDGVITRVIV